jgi:hypothetical protein
MADYREITDGGSSANLKENFRYAIRLKEKITLSEAVGLKNICTSLVPNMEQK